MKRIPRKSLVAAGALTLALAASSTAFGQAVNTDQFSEVTGGINSPVQDDAERKGASLFAQVSTYDINNDPVIPAAPSETVTIDFDEDIQIKTNAHLDECAAATITPLGTDGALQACRDALIGSGNAIARIPGLPSENQQTELTVAAFNGPSTTLGPVILLHADNAGLPANLVIGNVTDSPDAAFGRRLTVPDVPDVLGDTGALVFFNSQISRNWNNGKTGNKKKKYSYITARCSGAGTDYDFAASWLYRTPPPTVVSTTDTDTYSQDCANPAP